ARSPCWLMSLRTRGRRDAEPIGEQQRCIANRDTLLESDEFQNRAAAIAVAEAEPGARLQAHQELARIGAVVNWAHTRQLVASTPQLIKNAVAGKHHGQRHLRLDVPEVDLG